jgi:hypothetical protein
MDIIPIADIFAVANACGRWYVTDETVDLSMEE